ncbi:TetR/AcrR family transcriptional regulator [Ramlibacter sp.]|uniref:TetR/AcrR family transcriptional regulator n=1 Tax=Ramlibacter sp. TaxID=1917967 RepID=UPI002C2BBC73|nr:TetR/AcrR family transcriptional regulator [Ramlibacter sp.]HWI82351.1 TetR/AcrR family transcriptional regulator [Ramlibacter sp.]
MDSHPLTDAPVPSPAKRERRKEARPGELLAAALELFVEKGFAAARAEEVAARAGVSKGTLFLYFPSKEELFKAVVRENISGRFGEWNQQFQHYQGTSADLLRTCLALWWERVGASKASGISKLVISEARNFPDLAAFCQQEVVQPCHDLVCRILQRGIERGEFRAVDVPYAAFNIMGPMVFLMMMKHSFGPCLPQEQRLDPQRFIDAQVDTLLRGLCVREGAPAGAARQ